MYTDNEWTMIVKEDNVAQLESEHSDRVATIIQIVCCSNYNAPKICKYLVINHPEEFMQQVLDHRYDILRIASRYPIVRDLFAKSLLFKYINDGNYGNFALLFQDARREDILGFLDYLVSIGYTEIDLLGRMHRAFLMTGPKTTNRQLDHMKLFHEPKRSYTKQEVRQVLQHIDEN